SGYSPFVLVRNAQTGAVAAIDLTPDGSQAAGESNSSYQNTPVISADGQSVVFTSYSPLDANHPNGGNTYNNAYQAFERNLQTGTTPLVSFGADGHEANHGALKMAVSNDGRYVAFVSPSTNLVAGFVDNGPNAASNQDFNVYLWDRQNGSLKLVSHVPGN